ncbi:MAG: Hpt domain-containing protein, partial [Magnetococcales bacterium]|nr:Hpt domain-containing protein [Magnetococcales bacterium]
HLSKPLRRTDLMEVLNRHIGMIPPAPATPEPKRPHAIPHTVIDQETLSQLKDETGRGFIRIVEMFLKNLPGRLEALQQARESRDSETLRQVAHKLKGTSSTFGATRFSTLCAELEQLANRDPSQDTLQEMLNQVQEEGQEVQKYLESVLNEWKLP